MSFTIKLQSEKNTVGCNFFQILLIFYMSIEHTK